MCHTLCVLIVTQYNLESDSALIRNMLVGIVSADKRKIYIKNYSDRIHLSKLLNPMKTSRSLNHSDYLDTIDLDTDALT